jgi:N-acetylneuraminate synthase/N,N'-diacetyllegionaminate synthase
LDNHGNWPRKGIFLIAEAGVNHNGDLATAMKLVEVAARAGADAVKFQSFRAGRIATATAQKADYQLAGAGRGETQLEMLQRLELSPEDHRALCLFSREKRIAFLSSPFDEESADLLDVLKVPMFKMASGEITNLPLLRYVARKLRPVILSTGMSTLEEVGEALDAIRGEGNRDVMLLHCVTEYPAPPDQINLRAMETMRNAFHVPVGYSDHTAGLEMAIAAAALGASLIEKHFTLSRTMEGPDHRASLEPEELEELVRCIRNVEVGLGTGIKAPAPCEVKNLPAARKSVVAAVDIGAGTQITASMLTCKRPGSGLPPKEIDRIVGRRARKDIAADELLTWESVQ